MISNLSARDEQRQRRPEVKTRPGRIRRPDQSRDLVAWNTLCVASVPFRSDPSDLDRTRGLEQSQGGFLEHDRACHASRELI